MRQSRYSYPYIRAWGHILKSYDYYIRDQIAFAIRTKAPPDAIYFGASKRWHTVHEVENVATRELVLQIARNLQKEYSE